MPKVNSKTYKFPRRYSESYCRSTPYKKMGFTQRASCRPYKNCYKGGASKKRATTRKHSSKRESGNLRAKTHKVAHPSFVYTSEHVTYTSHPEAGEPFGMKTVVAVKNGKGTKELYHLDKSGATVKHNSKKLKSKEIKELTQGNYVPGLFKELN